MASGLRRYLRSLQRARRLLEFVGSPEYSEISGIFPLHFPSLDIELQAIPEQMACMLAKIEQSWTQMGEARPHHSVMTQDEYRPGNLACSIDSFWASGNGEAEIVDFHLRQLGSGDLGRRTCVEYGCGLGRVTIPLAARFAKLHAYDISASHLALARERAESLTTSNICFHYRGGGLLEPLEPCDFFYSRLVFQHNPPPVIRELVKLALSSLRPGGVAIFGIPVYLAGYRFHIGEYLEQPQTPHIEMHCIPQREIFSLVSTAGCSLVEVREERSVTPAQECLANLFVVARPADP